MIHEKIELQPFYNEKGIDNGGQKPCMTTYILDNYDEYSAGRERPVVVICPGGGYEFLSQREAEAVAIKMNSLGFHAVVVWYSVKPMMFPAALLDLAQAVGIVRARADEWHVKKSAVVVGGFSAGGHLAASLGVYWNSALIQKYFPCAPESVKPDGLMLAYPVIVAGKNSHDTSVKNVLGRSKEFFEDDVSLEKHVTKDVPPVFMWHTDEDGLVPLENSLAFASACRANGIPLEYHVFRKGAHGLSLADAQTAWADGNGVQKSCAMWTELFALWMESIG